MRYGLAERFSVWNTDALTGALIVAVFGAVAVAAGYVIASGQLLVLVLMLGAIAGVALLNALPVVVWMVIGGVLLVSGPIMLFAPSLERVGWLFSLLGFYLAGAALLYAAIGRDRFNSPAPTFVILAVVFLVYGLMSLAYSDGPLSEGVRAIKRYYQYFGLMFILAVVPFAPKLVRRWWSFLIVIAVIQLPFALYQRVELVPARLGLSRVDPIDIVAGTMEADMGGAGMNSVMALLLVTVLIFLLALHREGLLPIRRLLPLSLVILAPLGLGEVKLLIVLIPIGMICLHLELIKRNPFRFAGALVLSIGLVVGVGWIYLTLNAAPGQTLEQIIDGTIFYNFGQMGYYDEYSLNRTSVYLHWIKNQTLGDPVGLLFGHGLGSAFGGISELNPGHMDRQYPNLYIGLTAVSSILWDLGVVGLGLVLAIHGYAILSASSLVASAKPGFDRALCAALRALSAMVVLMLVYNDAPISVPSLQTLTALCFGLIAWRARQGPSLDWQAGSAARRPGLRVA
jgi:hypothetical protein